MAFALLTFLLCATGVRAKPPSGTDRDLLQRGLQRKDPINCLRTKHSQVSQAKKIILHDLHSEM